MRIHAHKERKRERPSTAPWLSQRSRILGRPAKPFLFDRVLVFKEQHENSAGFMSDGTYCLVCFFSNSNGKCNRKYRTSAAPRIRVLAGRLGQADRVQFAHVPFTSSGRFCLFLCRLGIFMNAPGCAKPTDRRGAGRLCLAPGQRIARPLGRQKKGERANATTGPTSNKKM